MSKGLSSHLVEPLTERELEVLRLLAAGLTNRQISEELVIGVETVRWYTKQIYGKLGVHSRTQASMRAVDLRLFDSADSQQARPEDKRRSNLPSYSTSFVGRQKELSEIGPLLTKPEIRLVTIAGPGGIGKTRLSVEAVRARIDSFSDGIFFVPLSPLHSVGEIVPAIARTIQLRLHGDESPEKQLMDYLSDKEMLLLLDNFEHLADGAQLVAELLSAAPSLRILATSRASLNLTNEWVRYLEGIKMPASPSAEDFETISAVALFRDRVRQVRSDFSVSENRQCVFEICRMIDGVPLAIELAAAWLKTLSCEDVASEIRHNIDFLATKQVDIDQRHRSIQAVFDYSWVLLSEEERSVLRRLSVFRGEFGGAAAQQVAGATLDLLSDLVDKSFVYRTPDGRYGIHDLLRFYVEEQLVGMAAGTLTTRSNMLLVWTMLIKGEFDRAKELADELLDARGGGRSISEEAFGLALLGVLAGMDEDYERCLQLCQASYSLQMKSPDLKDPITALFSQLGLAVAGCGLFDYQMAKQFIGAALSVAKELRSPAFGTLCLPIAAVVLAHEAEDERAVEMLGLALGGQVSVPAWMEGWTPLRQLSRDLQAEMGNAAFEELWNTGRRQEVESVVAGLADLFGTGHLPQRPN